ncbi:MAG TPA: AAA family ATPase [Candidatus Acidoferrales bacterium]|nr:AAA family ATPase [Candidatus Acidoferrales bacterium]
MASLNRAEIVETHISTVILVGDRAYKLKKPVKFGFLDFSTREARERACHREVALNRRLTPDVYLGVADVGSADGTPCDHLVVMRRMPADRRLATLVGRGLPVQDGLRAVARAAAAFHAACETSAPIAAAASPATVRANWDANFREMAPFVGPVLDPTEFARVEALARRYLDGRRDLFRQRMRDGLVVDGHGDLKADDIFLLDDGPRILDCIEFDDRLRYGDVLADVTFLAMDLERLGAPDLGRKFLDWYVEFSVESHPRSLAEHYIAYRAQVRSKVACLRYAQDVGPAAAEAKHLLKIAHTHLDRGRVRLILVGGLPGTGKSTLAAAIADRLGFAMLSTDEVRKELRTVGGSLDGPAGFGRGAYSPGNVARVYRTLLRRARVALRMGESVILDGSWTDATKRQAAHDLADATASDIVELECVAPPHLAMKRIAGRLRAGAGLSEATPQVAANMAVEAHSWPSATPINTSFRPTQSLQAALDAIVGEGPRDNRH